jgi:hypothetical protein
MTADELRQMTTDADSHNDFVGGTGREEAFRNFMLREIAIQLATLNGLLRNHLFGGN